MSARGDALGRVHALIGEEIAPGKMSLEEAKAFLEELEDDIDARLEGIKEDLRKEAK